MEETKSALNILVVWRGKKLNVEMKSGATLKAFGHKLQKLTNVKADTMRLLVPRSLDKGSKLFTPFSEEHSSLSLQETSILEGKSIRMMGVFEDEIEEVSKNSQADLRIAGFDEEEKRLRQRMLDRPQISLKLPQGAYIFCDFRTLHLPGIELDPPVSESLRRMHMLAADPGIIAIMNKHRWRVGIMTEMAPVGYVGVSPKCILGYNKNHGEEISLRLRTDDLKGFRKYESIKKTLLHELAHMVYSEHDANFYALDKQLNQEAASLDWTRSRSHTLGAIGHSARYDEEYNDGHSSSSSQKLGGKTSDQLSSARASSVAAAFRRLANVSTNSSGGFEVHVEPEPYDSGFIVHGEPDPDDSTVKEHMQADNPKEDDNLDYEKYFEPDPDDSQCGEVMKSEPFLGTNRNMVTLEPDPDDCKMTQYALHVGTDGKLVGFNTWEEPDPDDSQVKGTILEYANNDEPGPDDPQAIKLVEDEALLKKTSEEPDPDASELKVASLENRNSFEPDPDDSQINGVMEAEPDPDDNMENPLRSSRMQVDEPDSLRSSRMQIDEPDPDDQELQRIQDPGSVVCTRLQKAIEMLQSEVNPTEATSALQTLFKIIRNVIEHPEEIKFKKLRKANPMFQRNVANYKAAMEVLFLVGFNEDVVSDEVGKAETYIVLKRNDPGLLWLAKSSLEMCIA